MRKKVMGVAAGAVLFAGIGGGAAFAVASSGAPNTTPNAADGFYACVASGNKVANAYPAAGWHGTQCPSGQEMYLFPSQAGVDKAIADAVASIPAGQDGTDGTDGAPGVSGYVKVASDVVEINADSGVLTSTVVCPAGTVVLGGGVAPGTGGAALIDHGDYPAGPYDTHVPSRPTAWSAKVSATGPAQYRMWATCAIAQ